MAQLLTGTRIYGTGTVDTQLFVSGANTASSTTTGALQVVGGVGIGGALFASSINAVSSYPGTTAAVALSISNIYGNSTGTWILPYAASGNFNPTTQEGDSAFIFHGQTNGTLSALNIAPWSTTATGIRITNLGIVTVASTVASTGTATGALVVKGGVGIGGTLNVANTSYIAGAQVITTATIGQYAAASANSASSTGTTSTFLINNTTTSTGTSTGALQVRGGAGIVGNVYIGGTSYVNNSQILTSATIYNYIALRGQYIPRTAYVSTGTITIDASQYDTYVVTAINTSSVIIQINTDNGYTPFDGQKLIIRLTDDGTARRLHFNYNSNHFRVVGITPPAITLSNNTIYVGAMYNQSVGYWDMLSAVIQ
jgi:hypothetical protein